MCVGGCRAEILPESHRAPHSSPPVQYTQQVFPASLLQHLTNIPQGEELSCGDKMKRVNWKAEGRKREGGVRGGTSTTAGKAVTIGLTMPWHFFAVTVFI